MDRRERGRAAERLAGRLLVEHGLEPLDTNWRRRVGEIDLIMREPSDGTIVFVEVRYRSRGTPSGAPGGDVPDGMRSRNALEDALESVDRAKRARLRRAAVAWLQRHGDPDVAARIDVVAIAPCLASRPGSGTESESESESGSESDRTGSATAEGGGRSGNVADGGRPERIVVRRDGCLIAWIVGAIEDAD